MLYVIVEGKKATKPRSEKSRKFKIFAKGLVHGVGPKWAIFPSSYFRQCRPGKSVLPYLRKKKRLFRLEKKGHIVENLRFLQRVYLVFPALYALV